MLRGLHKLKTIIQWSEGGITYYEYLGFRELYRLIRVRNGLYTLVEDCIVLQNIARHKVNKMKNRYKKCFNNWRFYEIKTTKTKKVCSKCHRRITGPYRCGASSYYAYCLPCVSFIASRYENVYMDNLSVEELRLKEYYDQQIIHRILFGVYPQFEKNEH